MRGMNIVINPGESVALVGESGCGKSTFVNLMMRFYDVDHGQILFDGVDIKEINLHDLRMAISLVMQEPIIFNYTILENILYGKLDAKDSEVYKAAEQSNCNEFIENKNTKKFESMAAEDLIKEYQTQKEALIGLLGETKYKEELEILEKVKAQED